jgi:hypothetical protein
MPLRQLHLLVQPIVECLRHGERPSWEIEDELAQLFHVTKVERAQVHEKTGCPVWRNDVAWGFSRLVQAEKIKSIGQRRAPTGGKRNIYRLAGEGS